MNPFNELKRITSVFVVTFGLACFGLSPVVQAVSPAPDGGYPNFNTAEGQNALKDLTTGVDNTALGAYSMFSTTTANFNTAVGAGALDLNTGDSNTAVGVAALLLNTGTNNTAVGVDALGLNTSGGSNAAVGAFALYNNTTGFDNTASGEGALQSNTTGSNNTATGFEALLLNTEGLDNAADGAFALTSNTIGVGDTATGQAALFSNTTGNNNTACGLSALLNNTTANGNTAVGSQALETNTTGNLNTANGYQALINNTIGSGNTAIGNSAGSTLTTGNNNIAVGAGAGVGITTGDFNIDIGSVGTSLDSGTIRIGDLNTQFAVIAGISGVAIMGAPVVVTNGGQLGVSPSSARFKDQIKPMDKASEALFALKPVTFHYKKKIDPAGMSQFGLVAEDVEKVNPDLVVRDKEGKPYSVRYEQVNAMLLNEFLKEHRKVHELEATVAKQNKDFETALADLKEQIQKVSAQLELSKAAPQTVLNNR